jgi:hypothetical protein
MPVHGPCRIEGCTDPARSSGQWQYIPEAYCTEHDLTFEDDCTCKKAECRRKCGLVPEKQKPGRKRPAAESPPVGVALHEEELPRPPIILSMDEIWNARHAASRPPGPRRRDAASPADRPTRRDAPRARRNANLNEMGSVKRGNKLKFARSDTLEYAVHGRWRRTADDENGCWGCWYIDVPELVQAFGKQAVTAKLAEYEGALAAARDRRRRGARACGRRGGGGG